MTIQLYKYKYLILQIRKQSFALLKTITESVENTNGIPEEYFSNNNNCQEYYFRTVPQKYYTLIKLLLDDQKLKCNNPHIANIMHTNDVKLRKRF